LPIAVLLFGVTVSALWLGERIPLLGENKLVAAGATLLSRFGRRVEDQAA